MTRSEPDLVARTKANLREHRFTTLQNRSTSGPYVFFSFDLVNSTQFKTAQPHQWPVVVNHFYELVQAELSTRITSALLWKYVGDEVLFFKRVSNLSEVYKCVNAAYETARVTVEQLHRTHIESRQLLSLKAALWIAIAEWIPPSDIEKTNPQKRNIIITTETQESSARDFLGPDIDAGFRISRLALRGRVLVSAELAFLLFQNRRRFPRIGDQLKIVSLELMKGIWAGRHYPIIWFEKHWKNVPKSFLYDEHLTSPLVKRIKENPENEEFDIRAIKGILRDLGKEAVVRELAKALNGPGPVEDSDPIEIEVPREKRAEVHCVAICFSPEGKVLVAKRPASKKRLPNAFEFGCGQLRLDESFAACLRRAYKDDFGVEIHIPDEPTPVGTFLLKDEEEKRIIPGIIFVADIKNPSEALKNYSREKHTSVRWIDPARFPDGEWHQFVPNFKRDLRAAVKAHNEATLP